MIVVTGATGNVGHPLVRMLVDRGEKVTAVSRNVSAGQLPDGATAHRADLTEPARIAPGLDGADTLFLLTPPDVLGGNISLAPVIESARAYGLSKIVLLSSNGVATGRHPDIFEQQVIGSGLDWTILRPGAFASNALQWVPAVRAERRVSAPFGEVALPVVDPEDIAAVAAAALTDHRQVGANLELSAATLLLTGPQSISPRQQVAAIAAALGEPVEFEEQSEADAGAAMSRFMPAEVVESTLNVLGHPTAQEQQVSTDVERVLGRPANSFADWAVRNVDAFR